MSKFEIRVFQPHSNLMKVVKTIESEEVEDAIDILYKQAESDTTGIFFGQVWEVWDNDTKLHYEINE